MCEQLHFELRIEEKEIDWEQQNQCKQLLANVVMFEFWNPSILASKTEINSIRVCFISIENGENNIKKRNHYLLDLQVNGIWTNTPHNGNVNFNFIKEQTEYDQINCFFLFRVRFSSTIKIVVARTQTHTHIHIVLFHCRYEITKILICGLVDEAAI